MSNAATAVANCIDAIFNGDEHEIKKAFGDLEHHDIAEVFAELLHHIDIQAVERLAADFGFTMMMSTNGNIAWVEPRVVSDTLDPNDPFAQRTKER